MNRSLTLVLSLLALGACAASCDTTTAGQRVTIGGTATLGAVQLNQYLRDSRATQLASDATVQARAYMFAATADVATQTQIAVTQRAAAQATAAIYTQMAVSTQAVRDTTATAVHDADATATVAARIHADSVATRDAGVVATGTAQVRATQTAIELTAQQADATRQQIANWAALVLVVLLSIVCLLALWALADVAARRLQVARYGPNRNPLVILPGGVVYNPITGISNADALPAPLKAQLAVMGQEILALQAQHSPHTPVKPELSKSHEWHIGPVGFRKSEGPPITVEKLPTLALKGEPAAPKLEAPEKPVHYMYLQGQAVSEADRELMDLREFLERGAQSGWVRDGTWLGYQFASGHTCTKPRYYHLVDILAQAGVLVPEGNSKKLAGPLEQALAACNLESVRLD